MNKPSQKQSQLDSLEETLAYFLLNAFVVKDAKLVWQIVGETVGVWLCVLVSGWDAVITAKKTQQSFLY